MKKVITFVLTGLMASGVAFAAPDRAGKTDIGLNVSAGFMEDSDTAAYFGGNMSYGINSWSAIGFSAGYQNFSSSLDVGDLRGFPLMADIYWRGQNPDSPYVPYGVLGLGAIFWDFKESGLTAGSTVDVGTSFGMKLGGGVDWFFNDHWAIYFEGSYTFADSETTVKTASGSVSATADADFWNVGGGLKYLF